METVTGLASAALADEISGKAGRRASPLALQPRPQEAPEIFPVCSHCGIDPVDVAARMLSIGGNLAVVFFCGSCRKVFSVAPISAPAPQQGMLVRP